MTPPTEPPHVRMPRAEREAQMLEVSEGVFAARGFRGATMEEIADLVGVTKPLIYDYFGSKEGLFGGCERLAVRRDEQHRMTPDEAAELVMATLWDGLGAVAGRG